MASITAFVSNRGGIGKSSLASQLAPAVALAHPDRNVVLLDLSIQGDATTFLLGGVAEPNDPASGARTRGGEAAAALPRDKCAAGFLEALLTAPPLPMQPPPRATFWRGSPVAAVPAAAAEPDWKAHAVKPCEVHPAGRCPPNLYILAGGKSLYGVPFEGGLVPALRRALASSNAVVLIDTDAELSERGASLAGIAVADRLALVLSTSWSDYLRALDDPANSLLGALEYLRTAHPTLSPRIAHAVFNNVQKRLSAPGGTATVPGLLPFTPPSSSLEALADIAVHLRTVAVTRPQFFAFGHESNEAFMRAYVTGVPTVAESTWQAASTAGCPIACMACPTESQGHAAQHLAAVAAKIVV